jgi:hypothetical protein
VQPSRLNSARSTQPQNCRVVWREMTSSSSSLPGTSNCGKPKQMPVNRPEGWWGHKSQPQNVTALVESDVRNGQLYSANTRLLGTTIWADLVRSHCFVGNIEETPHRGERPTQAQWRSCAGMRHCCTAASECVVPKSRAAGPLRKSMKPLSGRRNQRKNGSRCTQ